MISGFLSYKVLCLRNFGTFIRKKSKRLLIPWICTFGIIYFVRGSMGYWFLLCLFQISVIGFFMFICMEKINRRAYWMIDVVVICLFYIVLRRLHIQDCNISGIPLGRFVGAFLPFFVGALLRKYKFLFSICIDNSRFYSCALISFVIIFSSRYLLEYGMVFNYLFHHSAVMLSILGSLLVFHAFANGLFMRLRPILSYLGKRTLPIYILHIMLVIQIPEVGNFILKQNAVASITIQIAYSTVLSVIAIILSLALYKIIIISPLFRRLLFGE